MKLIVLYLPMRGSDDMQIDYELIGERLKKARVEKGYSQEITSEKLDISVAYLSRIERGTSKINLTRLSEICDILDVSIAEILTGVEKESKQYLNEDLYNIIIQCSPEKQRLIYKIAKLVLLSSFV